MMPDAALTVADVVVCPHGGVVQALEPGHRVQSNGAELVAASDSALVYGCNAQSLGEPQPCTIVRWTTSATRVRILGQAPLLVTSEGIAVRADGVAAGPVRILTGAAALKMI